jgi:16S rRNA (guanine527-N7)-methyltransferase
MSVDPERAVELFRSILKAEVSSSGLCLPEDCLEKLVRHYELLVKWNPAVRLVGSTDPRIVARRHTLESLVLVSHVPRPDGALLDIGSGNGFPAIPLKCALPSLSLTMMEPMLKKTVFLESCLIELDLTRARVLRKRVDKPGDLTRLGRWDAITMRAVAVIPLAMATAPETLTPGGRILFMVGQAGLGQVRSLAKPPLEIVRVTPLPRRTASWLVSVGVS